MFDRVLNIPLDYVTLFYQSYLRYLEKVTGQWIFNYYVYSECFLFFSENLLYIYIYIPVKKPLKMIFEGMAYNLLLPRKFTIWTPSETFIKGFVTGLGYVFL